jgi:hypothetical protein
MATEQQTPPLSASPKLFVDFNEVEHRDNITRTFHQAEKYGTHPVLEQNAPWEQHRGMTASVVYDEQDRVFKTWYMSGHYAPDHGHVQCLALSEDGIHWTRPELGLHEALGSKQNNIVIPSSYHEGQDHFETMLKDSLDPDPARRYKAIGWSSYDWDGPLSGIYSATSPDGLNWHHSADPIFRYHPRPGTEDLGPVGDAQSMMVDTLKKRYVAFLRGVPCRLMSYSEDFVTWTPPAPFLYPLHEEEALYNNTGFVYGDQYLGILTHFNKGPLDQTQTLRLLSSRDGESWERIPGPSLVPLGEIGSWDRFQIMLSGAPPVRVGDRLFIYYRGTAHRHNKNPREYDPRLVADQGVHSMAIGLATLRADGFASVAASYDGGQLTTTLLHSDGNELVLNLKADYGQVQVECLDAENQIIPGYSKEECVPLQVDAVDARVEWQQGKNLAPLKDCSFKLRFHLYNARLYSYRSAD